jgi:hypothetical protein
MAKGLVLNSASFEPGGDEARQHNLEATLERAGFEVEAPPEPEAEENEQRLTAAERHNKHLKTYSAGVKKAKETYDDWDKAVNQDIHIGKEVQLAIFEQKNGAEVVYYLGKHPAFAKKLGALTAAGHAISAIREVERLSARLGANTPRPQAPARPVRPPVDATFAEIAAMPNYPGKSRDLKRAQYRR